MGEDKFEEERFMKALVNLKETQESIQVIRDGVFGDGFRGGGSLDPYNVVFKLATASCSRSQGPAPVCMSVREFV